MDVEKAIYRLKLHSTGAGLGNGTCVVNIEDVETILNAIENLKKKIPSMENGTYTGYFEGLLKLEQEIIKRDKIIDEIAEQLAGLPMYLDNEEIEILADKKDVIKYFTKKCEGK